MRNWSIRTRIMLGVIVINLVGMLVVMIYLHQSYAGGLDVTEQKSATLSVAAWDALNRVGGEALGDVTTPDGADKHVSSLKSITGSEYGVLIAKSSLDEATWAGQAEAAGVPNTWDEREAYVLIGATDEAAAEDMQLLAEPDTIPDIGKIIGVENGACSKMCHESMTGEGDFWGVRWSKDDKSRGHTVFPVTDDKGQTIGVVYSIDDISAQADSARETMVNTLAVIIIGLLLATLAIGVMLNALIFTRLDKMITSMEDISIRVAGGDFSAHFTPDGSTDEIGRFEEFFARFMELVANTLKALKP